MHPFQRGRASITRLKLREKIETGPMVGVEWGDFGVRLLVYFERGGGGEIHVR